MRIKILLLCVCAFSFSFAQYRVSLQGVKQASMGHTSADASDASILFFNPAGGVLNEKDYNFSAGVMGIALDVEYSNAAGDTGRTDELGTPMYFAVSAKPFNNKDVSLGLSVTTPFGSSLDWGQDWVGKDVAKNVDLAAFYIQPSIAYKVNDWLSLGYGIIFTKSSIELGRGVTIPGALIGAPVDLEGGVVLKDDNANQDNVGHNFGIYLTPTDKLDFSVAYRSKVDITANGSATFTGLPSPPFQLDDNFSATLPMPDEITFAAAYKVSPRLTLAAGFNLIGWSAYEELDLVLEKNTMLNRGAATKNFDNQLITRFGLEYKASDLVDLRLGYYHQPSPVPNENWSAETPAFDYNTFTTGAGFNFKNGISVDTYLAYLKAKDLTVNNTFGPQGDYKASAVMFGVGLNYAF